MAQSLNARVVGIAGADPLFARIRQEAEEAIRREPELALFLSVNVLNHHTLEGAVSHRVASRLDHRDLPAALIRQTFDEAIARNSSIGEAFHADIMAVADRDPACLRMIEPLLYFKGFQALQAYRLSHWLLKAGKRDFALSLQSIASAILGVDINPARTHRQRGVSRSCNEPRRRRNDCDRRQCFDPAGRDARGAPARRPGTGIPRSAMAC